MKSPHQTSIADQINSRMVEDPKTMPMSNVDMTILDIMKNQLLNYEALINYCSNYINVPGEIFNTEMISKIYHLINTDPNIRKEIVTFIDTLSILCIFKYNSSGDSITRMFLTALEYNRRGFNKFEEIKVINDAGTGTEEVNLVEFLNNHPLVLGFYIFSCMAFFHELDIPKEAVK